MRKGQAALEFLTTYGWAFLIILIMIGALAYFGVLNPKSLLPGRCTFGPEIDCLEHQILGATEILNFRVRNNVGSTSDFEFGATYLGGTNPNEMCTEISGAGLTNIKPGRTMEIECDFSGGAITFPDGDKVKFEITANYTKVDGLYKTPVKGEIYGDVQ